MWNGKVKEYINDKIKFTGEYLNGERNGKGKEYIDGNLKFDGEYSNGKINGKGKKYDKYGSLIFEAIYLNNKRKEILQEGNGQLNDKKEYNDIDIEYEDENFDD